ncbi:MAG: ribbon-helix-helix domain-containing protein [Anaerolineales bacterium]|nr:ribbon-helix-helix domain-containing protein [Anaerolineales bacterium]
MIERRNIKIQGKGTTIGLEPVFWQVVEYLAKGDIDQWMDNTLKIKPTGRGNASWARERALLDSIKPSIERALKIY